MSETPVAIVTGAARGIGRAIAATLHGQGYGLAMFDIDPAVRETAAGFGQALACVVDVGDPGQVERAVAATLARFGRIDALVNNAGVGLRKPLAEMTAAEWDRVLAVNLSGAFHCARAAASALKASRGAIVNIASTRALMSEAGSEAYAASKGGLVALTHALALSLAGAVRVNCVSPGWIDTKGEPLKPADHAQHPAGRVGRPEDVAEAVAYLLSGAAGFVTGVNLAVDGGMTRKMIYVE